MTTINKNSKNALTARVENFNTGFQKHFPNASTVLTFGGGIVTATVGEAATKLEQIVNNRTAVTTAQAAEAKVVAAENLALPPLIAFFDALEAYVRFLYGADPTILADFGLKPHKVPAPQTAQQKTVAAAKRAATRKARGTTSAKAKKAIKGNVAVSVVVTPQGATAATAPAEPAPAAPTAVTPPKA